MENKFVFTDFYMHLTISFFAPKAISLRLIWNKLARYLKLCRTHIRLAKRKQLKMIKIG